MKNHSAAEAAVAKSHINASLEFGRQFDLNHPPQVGSWFSFVPHSVEQMKKI